MKTANKIFYSVILTKLLAIGLVVFAATSQSKLDTQTNPDHDIAQTTSATSTTIERASETNMQTVSISTKRLTLEEKLAFDMKQARTMQANVQTNKKIRKIA